MKDDICTPGKSIDKDIFTSTRPFRDDKRGLYDAYEVYGAHFQSSDGKKHFKINLKDKGRGNVDVLICEAGGKKPWSTTESYGCKKILFDKTMKRSFATKKARAFIEDNKLFLLPLKQGERKDLWQMGATRDHEDMFEEIAHCGMKIGKDYHSNWKKFEEITKQLQSKYHYATWGDADKNIPEINVKIGNDAMEWFIYKRVK